MSPMMILSGLGRDLHQKQYSNPIVLSTESASAKHGIKITMARSSFTRLRIVT